MKNIKHKLHSVHKSILSLEWSVLKLFDIIHSFSLLMLFMFFLIQNGVCCFTFDKQVNLVKHSPAREEINAGCVWNTCTGEVVFFISEYVQIESKYKHKSVCTALTLPVLGWQHVLKYFHLCLQFTENVKLCSKVIRNDRLEWN